MGHVTPKGALGHIKKMMTQLFFSSIIPAYSHEFYHLFSFKGRIKATDRTFDEVKNYILEFITEQGKASLITVQRHVDWLPKHRVKIAFYTLLNDNLIEFLLLNFISILLKS